MDLETIIMERVLSDYLGGLVNTGVEMSIATSITGIFATIVSIFLFVVGIAFYGAMLTRISHKLNVFEKEVLAYIPVVRDCYRMRMVGNNPFLGLLINDTGIMITAIISMALFLLFKSVLLFVIVFILGIVANRFFTYKYYNKVLKLFGFEGTLALLIFIPAVDVALDVIGMIIAFSDKFENRTVQSLASRVNSIEDKVREISKPDNKSDNISNSKKAIIYGNKGKYGGSKFEIKDGESITIGRDSKICNIVYDDKYTGVSRNHCSIRYSAAENSFYVTDNSSNGTFVGGVLKIGQYNTKKVEAGTVICLGNDANSFRLG